MILSSLSRCIKFHWIHKFQNNNDQNLLDVIAFGSIHLENHCFISYHDTANWHWIKSAFLCIIDKERARVQLTINNFVTLNVWAFFFTLSFKLSCSFLLSLIKIAFVDCGKEFRFRIIFEAIFVYREQFAASVLETKKYCWCM